MWDAEAKMSEATLRMPPRILEPDFGIFRLLTLTFCIRHVKQETVPYFDVPRIQ
jgi:hypothetical protein